jgi:hypothetical protein
MAGIHHNKSLNDAMALIPGYSSELARVSKGVIPSFWRMTATCLKCLERTKPSAKRPSSQRVGIKETNSATALGMLCWMQITIVITVEDSYAGVLCS